MQKKSCQLETKKPRLNLRKDVLRTLSASQLGTVAGGSLRLTFTNHNLSSPKSAHPTLRRQSSSRSHRSPVVSPRE